MNKKETMLEVIQDKMGDKTLSRGTKIIWLNNDKTEDIILEQKSTTLYRTDLGYLDILENVGNYIVDNDIYIGDVLNYIEKNTFKKELETISQFKKHYQENELKKLAIWEHKKKPISEQSEECITYIFNLIKE